MTTVYSSGSDNPSRRQLIRLRIQAKAELWAFLTEITDELTAWQEGDKKLVQEITGVCCKLLHPHYAASELTGEVKNVLKALQTEHPTMYHDKIQVAVMNELTRVLGKL